MRNTLGFCRSTSVSPMKTTHGRPKRAQMVAVATPCCPAPVSAMMRVLPMRRASSTWPMQLLILCAPVWLSSSRLKIDLCPAKVLRQPLGEVERARPADIVLQQPVELFPEFRIVFGAQVFLLEIEHQRHQRLGDIAPAEIAEAAIGVRPLRPGVATIHRMFQSSAGPVGQAAPRPLDRAFRGLDEGPDLRGVLYAGACLHARGDIHRRSHRTRGSPRRRFRASARPTAPRACRD